MKNLNILIYFLLFLVVGTFAYAVQFWLMANEAKQEIESINSQITVSSVNNLDDVEKLKEIASQYLESIDKNQKYNLNIMTIFLVIYVSLSILFLLLALLAIQARKELTSVQSSKDSTLQSNPADTDPTP